MVLGTGRRRRRSVSLVKFATEFIIGTRIGVPAGSAIRYDMSYRNLFVVQVRLVAPLT